METNAFEKDMLRTVFNAATSQQPWQEGTEPHGGHGGSAWVWERSHMEEIIELENKAKKCVNPSHDHIFCICCAATYLSFGTGYVVLNFILRNADQLDHRC